MERLGLDEAQAAIAASLEKGRSLGLKPLAVIVVDAGGHPLAFARDNGSSNRRFQIAWAKAEGALALGMSSRKIAEAAAERPTFVASLAPLFPHGIVPAAGGVIIAGRDGAPIGAIGITGDTSDNDELCALAGIAAAGFRAGA